MNSSQVLEYYSNEFVLDKLVKNAKNREVGFALRSGAYDKRPNILQFANDVIHVVKKGTTSFHFSVERWSYPMQLVKKEHQDLRIGWDIIFDIDSKLGIEEAQLAAETICAFLEKYGIKNYGIKFSGSRGFHISLPWEMFPKEVNYKPLARQYPETPRIIANFVRHRIAKDLMKELVKRKGAKYLISLLDEAPSSLNPYYFVEIEKNFEVERNWGARHLFRAPFSLNEKTWNASVPIKDLKIFSVEDAKPQSIMKNTQKYDIEFFSGEENEALALLTDALDWHAMQKKEEKKIEKKPINWEHKVPEALFPPCIKIILSGMKDGRKRSLFTLAHFLRMMNWPWKEVEEKILEWNAKNETPLPRNIILMQLRYAQQNQLNPANCTNDEFYKSIGICRPDTICKKGSDTIKIKNPIAYPFRKMGEENRFKSRQYYCGICEKPFKSRKSLAIHKGRTHSVYE